MGFFIIPPGMSEFEERSRKRYVRDNMGIFSSMNGDSDPELFTTYDWPFIEEIGTYAHKEDGRIVLLTRDVFDYISHEERVNGAESRFEKMLSATSEETAKPTEWAHVTYGSDVSGMEVPFNPEQRQCLLFSEVGYGAKVFTVNFGCRLAKDINVNAPRDKTGGAVLMRHVPGNVLGLLEFHRVQLEGRDDWVAGPELLDKAVEAFDNIMRHSRHVI